ncbi:hydrolase [Nocardiopsis terrae]|uniref:Cof subfamily protein (Haloacid dehalogenase superfamily) n=1 Tax=Nocardiopsis terrae TaxID=372655 RepID=A0ABR9HB78_9ACTN|nr:HAD family hydrolase [Nocardiopsis terrae]MBE1456287.1 Cof subfamily protein (haloacid dehalogenase superfamily) [Nocardiopsis terrae]GHC77702.1 hydrolase [Nocardiopsis terrae]
MVLPRVIATDLDGTLLGRSGEVSDRNRRALTAAVEAGIKVVIVTARPPRTTEAFADMFDCAAVVCGNGAHTRLPGEPSPLVRAIDRDTSGTIVAKLRGALPELGFGVETGAGFYHDADYHLEPWVPRDWVSGVLDDTDALLEAATPVTKLIARSSTHPVHLMYEAAVASVGPLAEATYSGRAGLVELSAPGVNKGSTLAMLCERWGVSSEEVVAFGDMPNDRSALTWAGSGYAMSSGHPELLDPALGLKVAPSSFEDGVGRVVEDLLERA